MKKDSRYFQNRKRNEDFFWGIVNPCCSKCGYSAYRSALQLHHIDPSDKKNRFDTLGYWITLTKYNLVKKLSETKFVILCSRCHIETHCDLKNGIDVNFTPFDSSIFAKMLPGLKSTSWTEKAKLKRDSPVKICPKCKIEKQKSSGFYRNASRIDGYAAYCKDCTAKRISKPDPIKIKKPIYPPHYFENMIREKERIRELGQEN